MNPLFDAAFLERQIVLYPHLDVHAHAATVREYASRHHVANPRGLLVHWLRRHEDARLERVAARRVAEAGELDRYAALWTGLLRMASTRGLGPEQLRRCIAHARANGYGKLNDRLEAHLARAADGDGWKAVASPDATERNGVHGSRTLQLAGTRRSA